MLNSVLSINGVIFASNALYPSAPIPFAAPTGSSRSPQPFRPRKVWISFVGVPNRATATPNDVAPDFCTAGNTSSWNSARTSGIFPEITFVRPTRITGCLLYTSRCV